MSKSFYYYCEDGVFELLPYGKCFMWNREKDYDKLIELGYTELECKTCDREAIIVDVDKKVFEIVHKHVVIE